MARQITIFKFEFEFWGSYEFVNSLIACLVDRFKYLLY